MKKYLTKSIHDAHYKQMYQSVYYCTHQVPFSEISALDDDSFEPFFNKKVDNSIETLIEADENQELNLKSLISMLVNISFKLIANPPLNDTKLISRSVASSYMNDVNRHISTLILSYISHA
ncbi:unnamed protein product [Rhizophagus irregularis]|nr:unnamed protein product [Rhizophagus irregularis]